jgi:hypothetical protein
VVKLRLANTAAMLGVPSPDTAALGPDTQNKSINIGKSDAM